MGKTDIRGLYHYAHPCRDAEETRKFYEDLLGLPLVNFYFFDPNGLRLEVTARTERPGVLEAAAREAHDALRQWTKAKAERLGHAAGASQPCGRVGPGPCS